MSAPRTPDLRTLDEAGLETALRGLAASIDWPAAVPAAGPDLATRVRVRLQDRRATAIRRPMPWRRAAVLALIALLALAALAGAVGLGLPGLRLILGEPPASAIPSPTAGPSAAAPDVAPGSDLELGQARHARGGARADRPAPPAADRPDARTAGRGLRRSSARADQVALVWGSRPDLPASLEPGIGLILMSFDGRIHPSYATKVIGLGTTLERLRVGDDPGFWISGAPHYFFYETSDDAFIEESRRWVGDALIWSDGTTTYRLESGLGRDHRSRSRPRSPDPAGAAGSPVPLVEFALRFTRA